MLLILLTALSEQTQTIDVLLLRLSAWNTEQTVPSIQENNYLTENIVVELENKALTINIYDTPLGHRFIGALKDNLQNKRVLEKNFCWLGWADSKRDLRYLVRELNENIAVINKFDFDPAYQTIHPFVTDDFQYSRNNGLRLKHDACNQLHRHFEELQGKPDWIRPSQITTFLNAPRHLLHDEDFELFKTNRYDRELGGVYLHWSQIGKTLYEVFRDEHAPKMTDALCSEINHQKYYSGEFDVEWGQTITETNTFKKEEMDEFRSWLKANNYDWEDPKLALGYIKIGQVDLEAAFSTKSFLEVYKAMKNNLNIKSIHVVGSQTWKNDYPYTLESEDWKKIQMDNLKEGYESRSLRQMG